MNCLRTLFPAILCGSAALLISPTHAATYTWGGTTASWGTASAWSPATIPVSAPTTVLAFTGDVVNGTWTSTNNLGTATSPFVLNKISLQVMDANAEFSGVQDVITGNTIRFAGTAPEIRQDGSANIVINTPIEFSGELVFAGDGIFPPPGTVTLNAGISGIGDIRKTGFSSTFRFGTVPTGIIGQPTPSANAWMGKLIIEDGTIRFNNNAQAAASALRANPVVFGENGNGVLSARRDSGDEAAGFTTSLRMGAVSGTLGSIEALVFGSNTSNYDIVITALVNGNFGGAVTIPNPTGTGNDGGKLIVRGTQKQTLSGSLSIWKDTVVGNGATLALGGGASLYNPLNPASGAVTLAGGTLELDNRDVNLTQVTAQDQGRLRNGDAGSTTVETIGGGTLRLIGNAAGTIETTGRLQLGASTNPRSGHVKIEVVPSTGTGPLTQLAFQSYSRNETTVPQFSTIEFSAAQTNGNSIALGGTGAKILLTTNSAVFNVPLVNGLLATTAGGTSIGWATVNSPTGYYFASHNANGVLPVAVTNWNTAQAATVNAQISGSASTPGTGGNYAVNSIRMSQVGTANTLSIGADTLSTTAFLVASGAEYLIQSTTGSIGGNGPRFFHVQSGNLTVDAPLTGAAQPVVKAGPGTLTLARNNTALSQVVAINEGALRASPTTLPSGEVRLRGGQLEIQGGGTFTRNIGYGANTINWSGVQDTAGVPNEVDQDRGSGGFAASGADVSIDLDTPGASLISWEGLGFLRSGYALTFGSVSATNRVTWTDNLSLSAADLTDVNYNAREIKVLNNPGTTGDSARITGTISGRQTNDLLKTGPGDLELTATNTYLGATIVREGRLFVNGSGQSSFLHKIMAGGTLAGKGTVGNVQVDTGGSLAPGMTAGVASILTTKDVIFTDATSKLQVEIGGITPGGDGTSGYDQIKADDLNPATNLTISLNGATLEGTFLNGYLANLGDVFFIIINDGTDAVQGQFAQGNLVTIGSQNFNISYTANSDTGLFAGGNDVALQLVPEPSSALLLGLGTLLVARRRRSAACA